MRTGEIDLSQPFRLVGNGFASYTQGVAIGLNVSQPFRLMVGDGFAFYPRRCHWAKCISAFQAGEITFYTPSPNA